MFNRPPHTEILTVPGDAANPMCCCITRTKAANIPASSSNG